MSDKELMTGHPQSSRHCLPLPHWSVNGHIAPPEEKEAENVCAMCPGRKEIGAEVEAMAQGVMCLPCKHEELSSDPQTYSNMGAKCLYNPCIPMARWEAHGSASLTHRAVNRSLGSSCLNVAWLSGACEFVGVEFLHVVRSWSLYSMMPCWGSLGS